MPRTWAMFGLVLSIALPAKADRPTGVLRRHGCLACHSVDGTPSAGPTLSGLFGRTSDVIVHGERRRIRVDDAYVRRAIARPDAELVVGHSPGAMPALSVDERELDAVLAALHALPSERDATPRTMWPLAIGALGFLFLHLALSFHPVRSRMVARLGEKRFAGVYSLVIVATFGAMIAGWVVRPYVVLWSPPAWTRWIPPAATPIAFVLLVAGVTTPNPTAAGQQERAPRAPRGIVAITRHPALWGFALWALAHLATNGDLASLFLFGSVAALALLGMLHIDRRRARQLGDRWTEFARTTSLVPFAAILGGRARLDLGGLWWRVLVGLVVFAAMLAAHEWQFGASPLPY